MTVQKMKKVVGIRSWLEGKEMEIRSRSQKIAGTEPEETVGKLVEEDTLLVIEEVGEGEVASGKNLTTTSEKPATPISIGSQLSTSNGGTLFFFIIYIISKASISLYYNSEGSLYKAGCLFFIPVNINLVSEIFTFGVED